MEWIDGFCVAFRAAKEVEGDWDDGFYNEDGDPIDEPAEDDNDEVRP